MEIRVMIFEDNQNLRESLYQLIHGSEGFTCVGAYENCLNLMEDIHENKPDVVLMDIQMPGINGIEAVKRIREDYSELKILMETVFEDDEKVFQSVCAGANGYILKTTPPSEILKAIREIYEGGSPMTPIIASKVLRMFKNTVSNETDESYRLSVREKEILKYLVEGMSYKLIASNCFISIETVNGYIKNIYKKLQVHSKGEAVAKAIKGKII